MLPEIFNVETIQQTINNAIALSGIGLHTGQEVNLTLKPADEGFGIKFVRVDLPGSPIIESNTSMVVDTQLATTLGYNGYRISTVEHLLAALSGMGIDNLCIEADRPEIPIMDGSAAPFTSLLEEAGLKKQVQPKRFLRIKKSLQVAEGNSSIQVYPAEDMRIFYNIDFDHPLLKNQSYALVVEESTFSQEISPARTFGFLKDVETLKQNGYAKGGSLDNAIVIGSSGILNQEGLRFENEFVRHKILDLIGDLSLVGLPILGHIVAHRSGHTLNLALVRELLSQKDCSEIIKLQ
jgi:UDP-3-O-[3-hydroxymyristoyl] N-acetylglucosamine deacetylase